MQIPYFNLYKNVQEILNIKLEEFRHFGYESITSQELWSYCVEKVWRNRDVEKLRLHQLASGILGVNASQVVSYLQVQDLVKLDNTLLSEEEINFLLRSK